MANQNPFNSGSASKASRPLSAASVQTKQVEWAKAQVNAARQLDQQKRNLEATQPTPIETEPIASDENALSLDDLPNEADASDVDATTDINRRAETAGKGAVFVRTGYPPDPPIRTCAECGQSVGWLIPDPFRPERVVHQDCAGGITLTQRVPDAPYAFAAPYKFQIGATYSVAPDAEKPPDLPRNIDTGEDSMFR